MLVSESVGGLRVHCQCLAAVEDLFVLGAVVVGGRDRHRRWRGEGFAERLQVPDGTVLSLLR